ncbi:hypothetical protein CALCODRAFT_518044 [Calocera cornea HHB12733]|uniref:Uncharacterized protein n=1 Tax=Calocera cornea HHB12733 TaxID=1353952 RepID=A0A165FDH1_9BASI|nr:hypothetical protein CALCODRAFT_518044 [Calocera cornea HHB12733]
MTDLVESVKVLVGEIKDAILAGENNRLCDMFVPDGCYRDLLITSWEFSTVPATSLKEFFERQPLPKLEDLNLDPAHAVEEGSLPVQGRELITTSVYYLLAGV